MSYRTQFMRSLLQLIMSVCILGNAGPATQRYIQYGHDLVQLFPIPIFPQGLLRATGPQQQQRGGGGRELGLPRGQEDQEEEKEPQEEGLLRSRENQA